MILTQLVCLGSVSTDSPKPEQSRLCLYNLGLLLPLSICFLCCCCLKVFSSIKKKLHSRDLTQGCRRGESMTFYPAMALYRASEVGALAH